jgi:hypothetical protein
VTAADHRIGNDVVITQTGTVAAVVSPYPGFPLPFHVFAWQREQPLGGMTGRSSCIGSLSTSWLG